MGNLTNGSLVFALKNRISMDDYFNVVYQLISNIQSKQKEGRQVVLDINGMNLKDGKLLYNVKTEDAIYEVSAVRDFVKKLTTHCIFGEGQQLSDITKFMKTMDDVSEVNFYSSMIMYCEKELGIAPAVKLEKAEAAPAPAYQQPAPAPAYQQSAPEPVYQQPTLAPMYQQPTPPPARPVYQQPADGETGVLGEGFWANLEAQYNTPLNQNEINQYTISGQQSSAQYGNQPQYNDPYSNQNQYSNQGQYNNQQQYSQPAYNFTGNGETEVLDASFWQQIAGGAGQARMQTARLVHAKTNKVTVVNKENFWIGKGEVDLKIDKDIVSRKHAQIITRQNHYFVSDNGSTNKTFVDGKEVPAKASIEIFNGTHIKFANEEYIFQV